MALRAPARQVRGPASDLQALSFTLRTVGGGEELPGWRVAGERLLRDSSGGLIWLLDEPRRRRVSPTGVVALDDPGDWKLEDMDGGVALRCADPEALIDLVELRGGAARAFERDASAPMTVVPSFRALGRPEGLGDYLVGDLVVTGGPNGRWQADQVALSIYRIARLRGGAFWEQVAAHVAGAAARRVEAAPQGRVVTDHWRKGESHARFVTDAALLLQAHAELTGDKSFEQAAARAAEAIESFGVPLMGGRWYLHDSVEQEAGRNDLVLNTHVHAVTALRACGREVKPGLRALEAVLARRARGPQAIAVGAALAAGDAVRAFAPRRIGHPLARRAEQRLASLAGGAQALRIPCGYVARDASGAIAPAAYLAVNVADLAVLQRNTPCASAAAALAEGLRYARTFQYMRAELRDRRREAQVLLPHALRNAGRDREAARAVARARDAGLAPIIGWPGYEDALWSRLVPGTP
jgi:hypothetical protein